MTRDTIQVNVDLLRDAPKELRHLKAFEAWLISVLKAAGVPIKGHLVFGGLERGVLYRYNDFESPHIARFVWRDRNPEAK